MGVLQPGATLMERTFASTRAPPRLDRVPSTTPASASLHPTALTLTVPHPTTRPASVVRSDVLQIQAYIVLIQQTLVSTHPVLKPMALLRTTQPVNVALLRALQLQAYIVTNQ